MFAPNASYLIYNFPQLFEDAILHRFQIQPIQFEAMYTAYTAPNFITVPIGSQLVSYTGLGLGVVIFSCSIYMGFLVMYIGFYLNNYLIVMIGRVMFGGSAESLMICAPSIFGKWFMGKALSITQSANRAFINAGNAMAGIVGPTLFVKTRSMNPVFLFYGVYAFICFGFTTVYCLFEHYYEQKNNLDLTQKGSVLEIQSRKEGSNEGREDGQGSNIGSFNFKEDEILSEKEKIFTFKDLGHLSPSFWILTVIFSLGTNVSMMYNTFQTDFFMNRYGYTYQDPTQFYNVFSLACTVMIPVMSLLTTKYGYKGYLFALSSAVGVATFLGFSLLPAETNELLHNLLSLSYAFFSSLLLTLVWPCMTLSVPSQATTIAFGVATIMQNQLMTVLPLLFGAIDKDRSVSAYNISLYFLALMCFFNFVLSLWLTTRDLEKEGKLLHLPENSVKAAKARQRIEKAYLKYKLKQKDRAATMAMTEDYKTLGLPGTQTDTLKRDTEFSERFNSKNE